jgi:aldehyde:ferredoxin oxidoreductase
MLASQPERMEQLFGAEMDDLRAVGGRVVELERHFNNQRGFDVADDTLPYDLDGFESARQEYYDARGWNSDGTVPEEAVAYAG